jgi:hypothetical protein
VRLELLDLKRLELLYLLLGKLAPQVPRLGRVPRLPSVLCYHDVTEGGRGRVNLPEKRGVLAREKGRFGAERVGGRVTNRHRQRGRQTDTDTDTDKKAGAPGYQQRGTECQHHQRWQTELRARDTRARDTRAQ